MDSLRPKDDCSTMGIQFDEIDFCLLEDKGVYQIPYHAETKTFVNLDLDKATEFPKNLVVVEIPYKSTLGPIGYARWLGIDSKDILRNHPAVADRKAAILPWEKTLIGEIIKENQKQLQRSPKQPGSNNKLTRSGKKPLRKGRRM